MRTSRILAPEPPAEPATVAIRNSDRLAAAQPRSAIVAIEIRPRPDRIHVQGDAAAIPETPAERLRRELEELADLAYSAELL